MNPMVLYDLEKFHTASFRKFLKHKNEFLLDVISKNLERGIREGIVQAGDQCGHPVEVPAGVR
jgi:hypothetical protein